MEATASQFSLQGAGPFLHWLTLGILCAFPVLAGIALYKLGGWPGEIARKRNHPQAKAISVCGWMGIITIVLWPIAMVWAHVVPRREIAEGSGDQQAAETSATMAKLREATARLAAIERKLSQSGT
jgi:hypothetical protein